MEDQAAPPPVDLPALIGSRICHDLNNPLGAIDNGLELLELGGQTGSPEMQLIAQSVAAAKARVQFLRIAFGAAPPGHRIGGAELSVVVANHARGCRAKIAWAGPADAERAVAKLAFLCLMCVETAVPFGGRIAVTGGARSWTIEATAERLRLLPDYWDALAGCGPMPEVTAPQVQFALAAETARQQGRALQVEQGDGRIALAF